MTDRAAMVFRAWYRDARQTTDAPGIKVALVHFQDTRTKRTLTPQAFLAQFLFAKFLAQQLCAVSPLCCAGIKLVRKHTGESIISRSGLPDRNCVVQVMSQEKIRIMLVDELPARLEVLETTLTALGYLVVGKVTPLDNIQEAVETSQPDVILADLDSPGRDTLESMQAITRKRPRPIVMFTNDGDASTIKLAVKSGVTAYIVDGMTPDRIKPILDVAIMRFQEYQQLRNELEQTRLQLSDRKQIDKAKGLLMKRKSLDEEHAYQLLRKMAMDRNMKIAELARSIIAAAELLG